MSLWILIAGTLWLLMVAGFSFFMALFGGTRALDTGAGKVKNSFMTVMQVALPAVSILSIVMIWKAQPFFYGYSITWWLAFPLPFIILYMMYWSLSAH